MRHISYQQSLFSSHKLPTNFGALSLWSQCKLTTIQKLAELGRYTTQWIYSYTFSYLHAPDCRSDLDPEEFWNDFTDAPIPPPGKVLRLLCPTRNPPKERNDLPLSNPFFILATRASVASASQAKIHYPVKHLQMTCSSICPPSFSWTRCIGWNFDFVSLIDRKSVV